MRTVYRASPQATPRRAILATVVASALAAGSADASSRAAEFLFAEAATASASDRSTLLSKGFAPPALGGAGMSRRLAIFGAGCDPDDEECVPEPDPCDVPNPNPEICPVEPIYDPGRTITVGSGYVVPNRPDNSYQYLEAYGSGYINADHAIHVTLNGAQRSAVWTHGADSTIRLAAGSTISLRGDSAGVAADAVRSDGGRIVLDDVTINATNDHYATHPHTNDALRTTAATSRIEGKVHVTTLGSNAASAHDGSMEFHDSSFSTSGADVHTLYANGDRGDETSLPVGPGGTIIVRDSIVERGTGTGHAVYATGGRVELYNSDVSSSANQSHGLYAKHGAGSAKGTIIADDTNVTTRGNGAHGVYVDSDAVIAFNGGEVRTQGANAYGIFADNGGTVGVLADGSKDGTRVFTTGVGAHAVMAGKGSSITLNGGGKIVASGDNAHALYATGGSHISLLDQPTDIEANGKGAYGVFAEGGSRIDIAGGSVSSTDAQRHAVYATEGSTIVFDGHPVTITTAGAGAHGAFADSDSTLITHGGTIATSGSNAHGLFAKDALVGTLDHTTIATQGDGSMGAYASDGGTLVMAGADVSTEGQLAFGLRADKDSILLVDGTTDVTTLGAGTHAVYASEESMIALGGGSIATAGQAAHALYAVDSDVRVMDDIVISTRGDGSMGVHAVGADTTVVMRGAAVDTGGSEAHGLFTDGALVGVLGAADIRTQGDKAVGVYANHGGRMVLADGGSIHTEGTQAHGLFAEGESLIDATGKSFDIATAGDGAYGVYASDNSTVVISGGSISTAGANAHGMFADGTQMGALGAIDIHTQGDNAIGAYANAGARVVLTGGGSIHTEGTQAHGLFADGESLIDATGKSFDIATAGDGAYGVYASDNSTVVISGGSISTAGANAHGMFADGTQMGALGAIDIHSQGDNAIGAYANAGARVVLAGGGSIQTEGAQAHGLLAEGNSLIDARGGWFDVVTAGDGAHGIYATDTSTVLTDGGSVSTTGLGAHGLFAKGAQIGALGHTTIATQGGGSIGALVTGEGTLVLHGASISTQGDDAFGVRAEQDSILLIDGETRIETHGDHSHGAFASGGLLSLGGGAISTAGDSAHALYADNADVRVTGNTKISTLGAGSIGAYASGDEASIVARGMQIDTAGNQAHGLLADASLIGMTGSSAIWTHGDEAIGASAVNGGRVVLAGGSSIRTEGAQAHGVSARGDSLIDLSDGPVTIHTAGDGAYGAHLADGSRLLWNGGSVVTSGSAADAIRLQDAQVDARALSISTGGDNAFGIAAGDGTLNIAQSQIFTTGNQAHGVVLDGANLEASLTGLKVETTGADASALVVNRGNLDVVRDSQLVSREGDTLRLGGDQAVSFERSLLIGGTSVISNTGHSEVAFTGGTHAETFDSTVSLIDNQGEHLAVSLEDSSLKGVINTRQLDLDLRRGSQWTLTGNSAFEGELINAGTLYSTQLSLDTSLNNNAALYKTLDVSNYRSEGGHVYLNAYLDADGAPSDRLVADRVTLGQAGPTQLMIDGTGGGAPTNGNGIEIVHVNGGAAASDAEAFALAAPVVGGAWNYSLYQHGRGDEGEPVEDGNWYLRNHGWRPDLASYLSLQGMVGQADRALLDTLHDRIGDQVQEDAPRMWMRAMGRKGDADVRGSALDEGQSSYSYSVQGLQLGIDPYRVELDNNGYTAAGLRLGAIKLRADNIEGNDGLDGGSSKLSGYSIGGQWTHVRPDGAYVDAVALGTYYNDVRVMSPYVRRGADLKTHGVNALLSLEVGKPFELSSTWKLEPQAQLFHTRTHLNQGKDYSATVDFHDTHVTTARAGARLSKSFGAADNPSTDAWLRVNAWRTFDTPATMTISGPTGMAPETFRSSLGRTWGQAGVGLTSSLGNAAVYMSADYEFSLDSNRQRSVSAKVGLKLPW